MVVKLMIAVVLGVSVAYVNVQRTTHTPNMHTVDTYATTQWTTFIGHIAAEPDRRPLQIKYTIAVQSIVTASGNTIPVHGRTLATDHSGFPQYNYGDTVQVQGILEKPGTIETFSYNNYLSRYNIYSVVYRGKFTLVEAGKPTILGTLYNIKKHFEAQTNRLYAEPHASFMAGLLTGSRAGIPAKTTQDFTTTGLTHIIAISGYNITIIITLMSAALFWIPVRWRFMPSLVAIVCFTVFVGASAAVVRAAITGVLGLLALQYSRVANVRLTLLWTMSGMLLWNPKYLWYDAGFQLSFLAVLGLIELAPVLEKWLQWAPKTAGIRESLQMTIAAQLCAVPLLTLLFGQLSLVSPIANVLVAPLLPFAMLFGFLGTMVSYVWFFGGQVLAFLGWACLEWVLLVANVLAQVPKGSVQVSHMSPISIGIYYGLLLSWCYTQRRYQT